MKNGLIVVVVALSFLSVYGLAASAQEEDYPGWRFSAGVLWRSVDGITMSGGGYASADMVPAQARAGTTGTRANVGPARRTGDRVYDDGFVFTDYGTPYDGSTWYWGYEDPAQVRGDTLVFSASGGTKTEFSRNTSGSAMGPSDADDTDFGPALQAEYFLGDRDGFSMSAVIGLSYVSFCGEAEGRTFYDKQTWSTYALSVVDTYDLMGVIPPPAPYEGTLEGPGPLIPNVPASRSEEQRKIGSGVQEAWNDIRQSLDLDVLTLSIGIGVERIIGMLALFAAAGPAVNFASVDATYRESLYVSRNGAAAEAVQTWNDSTCESDVSLGAFAQGGASLALTERVSAAVLVRYDWADDLSESVGPSTIDADLSGYSVYGMLQFSI